MPTRILIALLLLIYACQQKVTTVSQNQDLISLQNDILTVKINPIGAELFSIQHQNTGLEYLWQGDSMYWADRSPIMFPVNVRFKDNQFTYKDKRFEMPRMGLAIKRDFKVKPLEDQSLAIFELSSDEETLQYYPFDFRLVVTYKLEGSKLINQFVVENNGADTMYFALGGHPGIRFPYDDGFSRKDYEYVFSDTMDIPRNEIIESLVQNNYIPFLKNENRLNLTDHRVPNNGIFLEHISSRRIGIGLKDEPPFAIVDLGDFPNVNLWSPPGMPFACIEPMVSHHDFADSPLAIEEKSYLEKLTSGESKTYQFSIEIFD